MKKIIFLTVFVLFALAGCDNLQWSEQAPYSMSWNEAIRYCENLDEDGHNDWRLPNIDELRTLIKAPETISGGKCLISEKAGKLSDEDYTKDCQGLTSKLGDTSSVFWSSSVQSANSDYAWHVGFYRGNVSYNDKSLPSGVRCVR